MHSVIYKTTIFHASSEEVTMSKVATADVKRKWVRITISATATRPGGWKFYGESQNGESNISRFQMVGIEFSRELYMHSHIIDKTVAIKKRRLKCVKLGEMNPQQKATTVTSTTFSGKQRIMWKAFSFKKIFDYTHVAKISDAISYLLLCPEPDACMVRNFEILKTDFRSFHSGLCHLQQIRFRHNTTP